MAASPARSASQCHRPHFPPAVIVRPAPNGSIRPAPSGSTVRLERGRRRLVVLRVRHVEVDQPLVLVGDGLGLGHGQTPSRAVHRVAVLLQPQVVLLRELDRGESGQAHDYTPRTGGAAGPAAQADRAMLMFSNSSSGWWAMARTVGSINPSSQSPNRTPGG